MKDLKEQFPGLSKWKPSTALLLFVTLVFFSQCQESVLTSDPDAQSISEKTSLQRESANGRAATDLAVYTVHTSSQLGGWEKEKLMDDNITTLWSSNVRTGANNLEWIAYWFSASQTTVYQVNYVKLRPRYEGTGAAQCFPVQFQIFASINGAWVSQATYTSFPKPQGEWIVLPLPATISATGIKIDATTLGQDNFGNYAFQLAEAAAGYDAAFNNFKFKGNQSTYRENEIRNVGSDSFNPNKLANWNYEYRYPFIAPAAGTNRNIYAPSVVDNTTAWNVYFGGWDGSSDMHDQVSITVSTDDFLNFNPHYTMVDNGVMDHVNNEHVIKTSDTNWLMYYTALPYGTGAINKPGYATSTNGVSWTPNAGTSGNLLNMSGYTNWNLADVNGSNVVLYENGTYHLYFDDLNYGASGHTASVHHATSTDMINYTYTGDVVNEFLIANDVKKFTYGGSNYYLMVMHINNAFLKQSIGTTPTSFGTPQVLLTNQADGDKHITSAGYVVRGNRLLGVLYGAGPSPSLTQNSIYAKWLQKKVVFVSDRTGAQWGDIERAYGPDRIRLTMATDIETGRFKVYDTDGTTLLYTSPQVTMRSGDIWEYQ